MGISKRLLLLSLCCLLVFPAVSPVIQAAVTPETLEEIVNDYIEVHVHPDTGRYSIQTKEGHPLKDRDQNQSLLFRDDFPETSFTTFRVNGKDYIYGNDYGWMGADSSFLHRPISQGLTNQSVWAVDGLEIIQKLTLVNNKENPNIGNVKISYEVTNTSDSAMQVGSRVLLDTMLGSDDGSPIALSGRNEFVRKETEVDEAIPYFWRAVDHALAPGVMSYGFLRGWGGEEPDRMIVAHWEGISGTKWEYQIDEKLDFTTLRNQYGSADSAVALYWEPTAIAPGEQRVYETYYGLGSFFSSEKQAKYDTQLIAPKELQVNAARDGYVQDIFEVQMVIDNTTSQAEPLQNVKARIGLPLELELLDGEQAEQSIGNIGIHDTKHVTWKVRAKPQTSYTAAQYWVSAQAEGGEELTRSSFVVLPALTGQLPEVQVLDVLPNKLFLEDDTHEIYLRGNGFEALQGNWELDTGLIRQSDGTRYEIQDISVVDDKRMTVRLDTLWRDTSPEPGLYTLEIDSGEYGVFEQTIELTTDESYRSRSYGLLAVTAEDEEYRIVAASSEDELELLRNKEEVLLAIRGKIQEISSGGRTIYEIAPGATINSVVHFDDSRTVQDRFQSKQSMVVEKKERDLYHADDFIEISGLGTLEIPSFSFMSGPFRIELEDGMDYALDADEEKGQLPIEVNWESLGWISAVQQISFFPITIKKAVIGDNSVSFGGSLALNFGALEQEQDKQKQKGTDPLKLSVDTDKISFGLQEDNTFGFIGLRAEGEVGLPEGFVPGMDVSAEARVAVDTFDNIYEMEAHVAFEVIEMDGLFTLRFTESSVPILDNFTFAVGGQPGIPLVPPAVVGYITKGGGGFKNLYDTVTGNYYSLPPLKLVLIGSMDLAKILEADDMTFEASLRGMSFTGGFDIAGMDILKEFSGSIILDDSPNHFAVAMKVNAELSVFEVIQGGLGATLSYDSSRTGIMGPIYMSGNAWVALVIPSYIPFTGDVEIARVEAEVSTESVYARAKALGIPVSVRYYWGDSSPVIRIQSASGDAGVSDEAGFADQKFYDGETGEYLGVMTYGDNFRVASSSKEQGSKDYHAVQILAFDGLEDSSQTYQIDIGEQDYALLELEYSGETPNIVVRDPDGQIVELKENINYRVQEISEEISQSGTLEQRVYVSMIDPKPGQWTVESDQSLEWTLLDVLELPALSEFSVEQTGDHSFRASWQAEHLAGGEVALYLAEDEADSGVLLKNGLNADSGSAEWTVPDTLASGDYYIKAVLYKDETNYHSLYSASTIQIENRYEPVQPNGVEVSPIGNGYYHVNWELPEEVDGFHLYVMDENGEPLAQAGGIEVEGNVREANIGGAFEDAQGQQFGMLPGHNYMISVTAYRMVDGVKVFSAPTYSDVMFLPEPNPAVIGLEVLADNGEIRQFVDSSGRKSYIVNHGAVLVSMQSDQLLDTEIQVNEAYRSAHTGQEWQQTIELQEGANMIQVTGVNEQGDRTIAGVRIISDTTPPDLKVEAAGADYMVTGDSLLIKGAAELGSTVSVNGNPLSLNEEGQFQTVLPMEGYLSRLISVMAEDDAGNQTMYQAEAVNQQVGNLERVEIHLAGSEESVEVGDSYMLDVDQSQVFQLAGIDAEGNVYSLDPTNVEWSILLGEQYGTMSPDGLLQAGHEGEIVVKASYDISRDFALEDTFIVEVRADDSSQPVEPGSDDEWYMPDTGGNSGDGRNDDDENEEEGQPIVHSSDPSIDTLLRQLLQSIIEEEQNVQFVTYAALSTDTDTVISIDNQAELRVFSQEWAETVGIGIGRVTNRSRYETDIVKVMGDIYEFKLSKPVSLAEPPELIVKFALEDVENVDHLGVYGYNERTQQWAYIGGDIQVLEGTVVARLPHLSNKYALLYNPNMPKFSDMEGRWSEDTVYRLASIGVLHGEQQESNTLFLPQRPINRQEFAKIVVAASRVPLNQDELPQVFTDREQAGTWAKPYLAAALERHWLVGSPDGETMRLEPWREISRAEAATIIARMLEDEISDEAAVQAAFKDKDEIAEWASPSISKLRTYGIISGYPDGSFRPNASITREEAAVMVQRVLDLLQKEGKSIE